MAMLSSSSVIEMAKTKNPDLYNSAKQLLVTNPDAVASASVAYASPEVLLAKLMLKVN